MLLSVGFAIGSDGLVLLYPYYMRIGVVIILIASYYIHTKVGTIEFLKSSILIASFICNRYYQKIFRDDFGQRDSTISMLVVYSIV